MKCLCGYEYDKWNITEKNDKLGNFIQIKGNFKIYKDWDETDKVYLYACPKCKTIQMKPLSTLKW